MERNGASFDANKWPELSEVLESSTLPDDRGLFIRAYDPNGSVDTSADGTPRKILTFQEGSYLVAEGSDNMCSFGKVRDNYPSRAAGLRALGWDIAASPTVYLDAFHNFGYLNQGLTGTEDSPNEQIGVSRPKNRNYLAIIYSGPPAS